MRSILRYQLPKIFKLQQPYRCPFKQIRSTLIHTGSKKKVEFGILFDIDGVLARGYVPLPQAVSAFRLLQDDSGNVGTPLAFVTNATSLTDYKASQLSEWLGVKIRGEQLVMAPSPLEVLTELHRKHCLVVGQGPLTQIAHNLGFSIISTIEDVVQAYPLLDVADHERRSKVATLIEDTVTDFPAIEAILLLGEPRHWETPLQVVVDLLLTRGRPCASGHRLSTQTLPVVACNMDLQYMHRAAYPRYGHGAFLLCLETLFEKLTGTELQYQYVAGKPSEITFRYAEHVISRQAKRMGIKSQIRRLYTIGDNLEVDIYGANLYQQYLNRSHIQGTSYTLPQSRRIPRYAELFPQTVDTIHSVLVRTGVYQESGSVSSDTLDSHSHRDFPIDAELLVPSVITHSVLDAVQWILNTEKLVIV